MNFSKLLFTKHYSIFSLKPKLKDPNRTSVSHWDSLILFRSKVIQFEGHIFLKVARRKFVEEKKNQLFEKNPERRANIRERVKRNFSSGQIEEDIWKKNSLCCCCLRKIWRKSPSAHPRIVWKGFPYSLLISQSIPTLPWLIARRGRIRYSKLR